MQTIALNSPDFASDRYGTIERLRAESFFAKTPDGGTIFYNQDDVQEVFRCKNYRFYFEGIDHTKSPYLAKAIQHELLNMHGANHARLSRLVKIALRDRIVEDMRTSITQIATNLVQNLEAGRPVDFCKAVADPLPGQILGPMFGVPYDRVEGLNEWIEVGGRKLDALQTGVGIDEVEDANRRIHSYLRALLKERRRRPGNDLFSELMQAEIDGDRMSEDEIVYLAAELASAGVDTTRTQLPLILLLLLQHPSEMEKLRANSSLTLRAVDEGMRFSPLPWALPHQVTHDHDYKGLKFQTGEIVYALVPGANRDPAHVEDPQTFNITREKRPRSFAFGGGMHACPGAQLARLEMSAALEQMITTYSDIQLEEEPNWRPGHQHRGLETLYIQVR